MKCNVFFVEFMLAVVHLTTSISMNRYWLEYPTCTSFYEVNIDLSRLFSERKRKRIYRVNGHSASFIVSLYLSCYSLHSFFLKRFVFLSSIKSNVFFIAKNCRCYSTNDTSDWSNFPTRQSLLFASRFVLVHRSGSFSI